uniref:Uncharacterized protein n=1 Tax=Methanococcus maripaludis (strain C6 / ATCC BAA-1332) TaxID=444158 RepID=A9A7D4_METM6
MGILGGIMEYNIRYQDDEIEKKIQCLDENTLLTAKSIVGENNCVEVLFRIIQDGCQKKLKVHNTCEKRVELGLKESIIKEILVYGIPKPLWDCIC